MIRTSLHAIRSVAIAVASLVSGGVLHAGEIYSTNFDKYGTGNLQGQLAWTGVGGTWGTSGATNAPLVAASVLGPGVHPGVNPFGGTGRMVRVATERFNGGRSKAWLDLASSGRWAAASADGSTVLETRVKLLVPAGQPVASTFGIMISRTAAETSGGFLVNAQTGAISLLNGGYAPSNRVATGAVAALGTWNEFIYRWDVASGAGELLLNGAPVATHVTSASGGVYASNLFSTTDAAPGTASAFGFFDDLSMSAVAAAAPCAGDFNDDGQRDALDLATLLAAWGGSGGDVNDDGTTNAIDLAQLLAGWGACP